MDVFKLLIVVCFLRNRFSSLCITTVCLKSKIKPLRSQYFILFKTSLSK